MTCSFMVASICYQKIMSALASMFIVVPAGVIVVVAKNALINNKEAIKKIIFRVSSIGIVIDMINIIIHQIQALCTTTLTSK